MLTRTLWSTSTTRNRDGRAGLLSLPDSANRCSHLFEGREVSSFGSGGCGILSADERQCQLYPARHAVARAWVRAAVPDQRGGRWLPAEGRSALPARSSGVTVVGSTVLLPHTDEPLWRRLQRLARWPTAIRLGLPAEPDERPSPQV